MKITNEDIERVKNHRRKGMKSVSHPKEYKKKYRQEHKQQIKEYKKKYYQERKSGLSETKIPLQIISWNEMPSANKFLLLKVFDFDMDKEGFIIKNGERIRDKYTGEYVRFDTVALFPNKLGKPIVFNDNPLSIVSYLEEYEGQKN